MKKTMKYTLLAGQCAVFAGLVLAGTAQAETMSETTTSTTTTTQKTTISERNAIDISKLDGNSSGTVSLEEIGERLFYIYDTDGNEIIDNNEFEEKNVVTVIPVEQETVTVTDFDADGHPDETRYSHSHFMERTRLSQFDENNDGLSARDFIGTYFRDLDANEDNAIDLREWKHAYSTEVKEPIDESESYN